MTSLALSLLAGGHSKDGNPILLLICVIPCVFTIKIVEALELFRVAPNTLAILMTFLIQFVVYVIIGLILSMVVCKKAKSDSNPDNWFFP